MKMLPISRMLMICILFCACKKEIDKKEIDNPYPTAQYDHHGFYPAEKGEPVSFTKGTDTLYFEKKRGMYVWCGDIVFSENDLKDFLAVPDSNARTTTFDAARIWTNRTVYYSIAPGFPQDELDMINEAITHFDSNTELTFVQRTNQTKYISIQRGGLGSWHYSTSIGMAGNGQIINLEADEFHTGNVIHELGHAVGLHHEHQRSDRDQFITVDFNNIQNGFHPQYQTWQQLGVSGTEIGTFDFNSVMLYGSRSGAAVNPLLPVMTDINGWEFIGQRVGLSLGDQQAITYLYTPFYWEIEDVYINDIYDPSTGDYYRVWDSYMRLYSNAAKTIPYVLPYAVKIRAHHSWNGSYTAPHNYDYNFTIATGQSGALLGRCTEWATYDYGTQIAYERDVRSVQPAAGYTY